MAGLLDALRQYVRDAMPGGALNPEVNRQGLLDSAAFATTPVPFVGDAVGLLADANRYATDPSSRTPINFGLSALGLLPFVPGMTTIKHTDDFWYHGSPVDIYGPEGRGWFKLSAGESGVPAVWATRDWTMAEPYSRGEIKLQQDAMGKFPLEKSYYPDKSGGGVYSLKSLAKNPLEYDAGGKDWFTVPQAKVLKEAQEKGHDAVIFKNIKDGYQRGGPADDVIAWLSTSAFDKGR